VQVVRLRWPPGLVENRQGSQARSHRADRSAAFDRFAEFSEKWEHKYPAIVRLWTNAWAEFGPGYDVEIRKEELVGPDWPLT
jgi:transposase-like protein